MKGFMGALGFGVPARVPTDEVVPLSIMDRSGAVADTIGWTMLRFDVVLDYNKLRDALAHVITIGDWRKLGGRFRKNAKGELCIHIPKDFTADRPAISFSHAQHHCPIGEHHLGSKLPKPTPDKASVQAPPETFHSLAQPPGAPRRLTDYLCSDMPQLWLHVVTFSDATLTCLTWPHATMDGTALADLLQAWALVLAGRESMVPPVLSIKHDLLGDLIADDTVKKGLIKEEKYYLASRVISNVFMRLLWMFMLMVRVFFAGAMESRMVWVPKRVLAKLQQEALASAESETGNKALGSSSGNTSDSSAATPAKKTPLLPSGLQADRKTGKPFISESDALIAFFARAACRELGSSRRTVNISTIVNVRDRLPSLTARLPKPGVLISSLALSVQSLLPAHIINPKDGSSSLGTIAATLRSNLVSAVTEPQLRALAKIQQEGYESKVVGLPIIGGVDTYLVLFSSLDVGRLFEVNMFAPAIARTGEKLRPVDGGAGDAAATASVKPKGVDAGAQTEEIKEKGKEAVTEPAVDGEVKGQMNEKKAAEKAAVDAVSDEKKANEANGQPQGHTQPKQEAMPIVPPEVATSQASPKAKPDAAKTAVAKPDAAKVAAAEAIRKAAGRGCLPVGLLVLPEKSGSVLDKMNFFILTRGAQGAWIQGRMQTSLWKKVEEELAAM